MVQIIDRPRTTGEKLAGAFSSVGEGIGQAIGGHYQAKEVKKQMAQENEQLKQLTGMDFSGISDPKLRQEAFSKALQAKQEADLDQQILGGGESFLEGESLAPGILDYTKLPEEKLIALQRSKKHAAPAKAALKARQGPNKTQASQPIDPQQLDIIQSVRATPGFNEADEYTKYQMLTDAGVSKENAGKESELSGEMQKNKEQFDIEYHKRSQPFVDETKKSYQQAENQKLATRQMRESLSRGDTGYGVFRSAFGSMLPGNLMEQFLSPDEAVFEASIPNLLEGMKDLFGVRLTDSDLRLVRGKLPSLGKSPQANEQILDFLDNMANLKELKYNIMREEEKKHPKNRPSSFENEVMAKYEPKAREQKDRYFAEFRLPSKHAQNVKKTPLSKGSVRLVSPKGEVVDFDKADKEDIDTLKNKYDYLILMES